MASGPTAPMVRGGVGRYTERRPYRAGDRAGPRRSTLPTYEYACKDCESHLEIVQRFDDQPLTECPSCGGQLRKVFGAVGIAFKGSGFYKTDNRSSVKGDGGSQAKKADGSAGANGKDGSGSKTSGDTGAGSDKPAAAKSDSTAKSDSAAKSA
jgi:putative FmdB family regulatory protein